MSINIQPTPSVLSRFERMRAHGANLDDRNRTHQFKVNEQWLDYMVFFDKEGGCEVVAKRARANAVEGGAEAVKKYLTAFFNGYFFKNEPVNEPVNTPIQETSSEQV